MRLAIVAAVLAAGCHGWTARDTALEIAAVASLAVDWHQTQTCFDQPPVRCHERNPIMGERGQRLSPEDYFIGVAILHVAIAAVLPHGWIRTSFQVVTTIAETKQIVDNVQEFSRTNQPMW